MRASLCNSLTNNLAITWLRFDFLFVPLANQGQSLDGDLHRPDTARTDASADAAADTDIIVRDVLESTVFLLHATDRALRTSFKTHGAVTTSTAGDTTQRLVLGVGDAELAAVARLKELLGKATLINHLRLDNRRQFLTSQVLVDLQSSFLTSTNGVGE